MEQQTNPKTNDATPKTKQPWRKPTLIFMPLQVTANSTGSGQDALTVQLA